MKKIFLFIGLCTLLAGPVFTQSQQEKAYMIFLLAGQSNMDGCGRSEELPKAYRLPPRNVVTWDNKAEAWVQLGDDSFAAAREQQFGPEIAFSHKMSAAYPDHTIAIIKTSAGGTKLYNHWLPGLKMHERFIQNIDHATSQLKNSDRTFEICGMLWMQGESDSETAEMAEAYENNLKIFIQDIRLETESEDLPLVMGRISSSLLKETPWNFDQARIVQNAQERVADGDVNVHIINTDKLPCLEDNTHFNTKAQLKLGKAMARIMKSEI
ncbi:MAG: sialate O-acetylesterase [Bacteroidetes bacterium]|nr:sialate O-acetylesterase [Bacteroidota bacterium]